VENRNARNSEQNLGCNVMNDLQKSAKVKEVERGKKSKKKRPKEASQQENSDLHRGGWT